MFLFVFTAESSRLTVVMTETMLLRDNDFTNWAQIRHSDNFWRKQENIWAQFCINIYQQVSVLSCKIATLLRTVHPESVDNDITMLHAMLHHPLALCTLSSCHCFQLGKMHQSQLALHLWFWKWDLA